MSRIGRGMVMPNDFKDFWRSSRLRYHGRQALVSASAAVLQLNWCVPAATSLSRLSQSCGCCVADEVQGDSSIHFRAGSEPELISCAWLDFNWA